MKWKLLWVRSGLALTFVAAMAALTFAQSQGGGGKDAPAPARTPFQKRISVTPLGTGFQTEFLQIPAGKRLVIENISAIARMGAGQRMEMNFFTYFDNGDGQGGLAAITFHRITLFEQGTFDNYSIYSGNHKMLVFADEQIGTNHYSIGVQARLNAAPTVPSQGQVTFTGYLEDLPAVQ